MLRLATADVLPYNLAAIAQDYLDSLREYDEDAGDILPFGDLMAQARRLKEKLAAFQDEHRGAIDPRATAATNRLLLRIARALNPILYQICCPFEHDPALGSRALPSLGPSLSLKSLEKDSDAYRFAIVGLKRRMNQVAHQLLVAERLLDQA